MAVMPLQKPGRSVQEVGTPRDFLAAVSSRFGVIGFDLAANKGNHVRQCWYGPGSTIAEDALTQDWSDWTGLLWLNPPFANIGPWATKCVEESKKGATIAMLVPASVGSEWFAAHVHNKALVLALRPRLTFVGSKDPYPRDLMLCIYGPLETPRFDVWRWKP